MIDNLRVKLIAVRDQFKLIAAQDEGAGGNLRPDEIYKSMQRLAREGVSYMDGLVASTKEVTAASEDQLARQIKETVQHLNQLVRTAERKGLEVRVDSEVIGYDSTSGARRTVTELFASVYRRL